MNIEVPYTVGNFKMSDNIGIILDPLETFQTARKYRSFRAIWKLCQNQRIWESLIQFRTKIWAVGSFLKYQRIWESLSQLETVQSVRECESPSVGWKLFKMSENMVFLSYQLAGDWSPLLVSRGIKFIVCVKYGIWCVFGFDFR